MDPNIFLTGIINTLIWTTVSVVIVLIVFELFERRYHLMKEIFEENSTASAILAGSFVLGIFYVVTQIVIN